MLNGRVNAMWNNLCDNARRVISVDRWPMNFLEFNEEDARSGGIVSGDLLSISSDSIRDQLGNPTSGAFTAVAYVSDIVPPGVTSPISCTREGLQIR